MADDFMVGRAGLEPEKAMPADLPSAPFDRHRFHLEFDQIRVGTSSKRYSTERISTRTRIEIT